MDKMIILPTLSELRNLSLANFACRQLLGVILFADGSHIPIEVSFFLPADFSIGKASIVLTYK